MEESFEVGPSDDPDMMHLLLLQHDPESANIQDEHGWLLLHKACRYNAPEEVFELLMDLNPDALLAPCGGNADPEVVDMLPLHLASYYAWSAEAISLLLSRQPQAARERDLNGRVPLHHALHCEFEVAFDVRVPDDAIVSLLDVYPEGARVEDNDGSFPLQHYSCEKLEVCSRLVELCPESVHRAKFLGDLPLHLACAAEESALDVVKFLYKLYPEIIYFRGHNGCLPLHWILHCEFWDDDDDERTAIVEFLIEKHPEAAQSTDDEGRLPIHYVYEAGVPAHIIQLLMDHYQGEAVHVNGLRVADNQGRVPLHYAVMWAPSIEMVQFLLEQDPEGVRVRDNAGRLAIHYACARLSESSLEAARLLLEIDPLTILQQGGDGRTALQLAFDATGQWYEHTFETKMFLVDKQDEAERVVHEAFEPIIELPEEIVKHIWGLVLGDLWRPSKEEYPRANQREE